MALKNACTDGRVVYVSGQVDSYMLQQRRQIRELVMTNPKADISIVISSPGGSVYGGYALMDEMAAVRAERLDPTSDVLTSFLGVVQGWAMSMGSIILQACDRRLAGPNALLMVHGVTSGTLGDEIGQEIHLDLVREINDRAADLYASRTVPAGGRSFRQWREILRSNVPRYFTARQALAEGLIDEVI